LENEKYEKRAGLFVFLEKQKIKKILVG